MRILQTLKFHRVILCFLFSFTLGTETWVLAASDRSGKSQKNRALVRARGELDKLEGPTKVSSQPLAGSQASASWHAQGVAADFLLPAASC